VTRNDDDDDDDNNNNNNNMETLTIMFPRKHNETATCEIRLYVAAFVCNLLHVFKTPININRYFTVPTQDKLLLTRYQFLT
jgi:hypothetical protein